MLKFYLDFLSVASSGEESMSALRFSELLGFSVSSLIRNCCIRQSTALMMFSLSLGFVCQKKEKSIHN
jgi:hypothetical protein